MAKAQAKKSTPGAPRKKASGDDDALLDRRRQLIDITAELFAEQGYKATTVRAIGRKAGVLSGSLYYHFDSKEAIADELFASYFDELVATYRSIIEEGGEPRATIRRIVHAAFEAIGQHRAANVVLQNEGEYLAQFPRFKYLKDREREIERLWTGVIKDGIESGAFLSDLDPRMVYRFIRDGVWAAVRWYKPSGRLKAGDLADQYCSIILDGIAAPKAKVRRTP